MSGCCLLQTGFHHPLIQKDLRARRTSTRNEERIVTERVVNYGLRLITVLDKMPRFNLRDIALNERIEADVRIIGSGLAGATIARELQDRRLIDIVVESGEVECDPEADSLNESENIDRPRVTDRRLVRNRMRIATDPKFDVVDENFQVHDVYGLFIAGSPVFPTSGQANPAHMIVAMAIRPADFLKRKISTGAL